MRSGVDYYGVLGVSHSAGPEELKRRYRQLVRNHHPDVADDPEAAQERFILVVEAYRTLSDPARRRAYDALQSAAPPPVRTRSAAVQEQIDDWFRHAVHSSEQSDLAGAAAQCRKILSLDPDHAAAQGMLGDIHAQRLEWDQALVWYSGAVSAAPRNPAYARKLRAAAEAGQQARATAERRERAAGQRRRAVEALNARHEFGAYGGVIGLGWLTLVLAWAARDPGALPAPWFPLPTRLAIAAVATGLAAGFVLGVNRLPYTPTARPANRAAAAALCIVSVTQFYLGLAGYVVYALVRERLVPVISVAFAVSFMLVVALAGLALTIPHPEPDLWVSTAAWSGNLVFPALLLGLGLGRLGLRTI